MVDGPGEAHTQRHSISAAAGAFTPSLGSSTSVMVLGPSLKGQRGLFSGRCQRKGFFKGQ